MSRRKYTYEIIVDLSGTDIGTSIKISSVKLNENVIPTITDRDFVIATVASPTVIKEPEKPAEGEATAEGAAGKLQQKVRKQLLRMETELKKMINQKRVLTKKLTKKNLLKKNLLKRNN